MSFSIQAQAATKELALAIIREKMAVIVQQQPSHAKDHDEVIAVTEVYAGMIEEDADKDILMSVSGSLGWQYPPTEPGQVPTEFSAASISVSVYQTTRQPADQVV